MKRVFACITGLLLGCAVLLVSSATAQEEPKAKEKGSGDIEEKELKEDGLIPQ